MKLTAYDYLIYGALEGKIERISADTITDDRGERMYRVIVRTKQNHFEDGERQSANHPRHGGNRGYPDRREDGFGLFAEAHQTWPKRGTPRTLTPFQAVSGISHINRVNQKII